jgi:hypothetical protein
MSGRRADKIEAGDVSIRPPDVGPEALAIAAQRLTTRTQPFLTATVLRSDRSSSLLLLLLFLTSSLNLCHSEDFSQGMIARTT